MTWFVATTEQGRKMLRPYGVAKGSRASPFLKDTIYGIFLVVLEKHRQRIGGRTATDRGV